MISKMNEITYNIKGNFVTNLKGNLIKLIAGKTPVFVNVDISLAQSIPYDKKLGFIMINSKFDGTKSTDTTLLRENEILDS